MDDNLDSVREIEISFSEMEQRCDDLLLKTLGHLDQLVRTMENSKNGPSGTFRKEHDDLKDDIDHFVKEFQNIKKDVLAFTAYILKSEQNAHTRQLTVA